MDVLLNGVKGFHTIKPTNKILVEIKGNWNVSRKKEHFGVCC
jgi:hypothetical protein